jgi:hypothetical protein
MKKIRYSVDMRGKPPVDVEGYAVDGGAFGLRYLRDLREWRLDHLASGAVLYSCRSKDEALALVAEILPLADWPLITRLTSKEVLKPIHDRVVAFRTNAKLLRQ